MNQRLLAKVDAVNRANEAASLLQPLLLAAFAPLVGQKIVKQNGDLLQKFEKVMPVLPNSREIMVYRARSEYSLAWVVKVCANQPDGNGCKYHETYIYVGDLSGATLTKLSPQQTYRADYSAEKVIQQREAVKQAERALSDARSALHPFSEHDN